MQRELELVKVDGLDQAQLSVEADEFERILGSIGGFLRSVSVDGATAGMLEDGVFGIVRNADAPAIADQISEVVKETNQDIELDVKSQSLAMSEAALSKDEASQALVHVLKSFAGEIEGSSEITSLGDALQESYRDTVQRIANFREIVSGLDFNLVYQPIVHLSDRSVHHFEALSRFRQWDKTFEVMAFAEDVGITVDFDLAVVRKVLEYVATFSRRAPGVRALLLTFPPVRSNKINS